MRVEGRMGMRIGWSILSLVVTAQPMVGVCGRDLLHPPGRSTGTTSAALSQSEEEEEGGARSVQSLLPLLSLFSCWRSSDDPFPPLHPKMTQRCSPAVSLLPTPPLPHTLPSFPPPPLFPPLLPPPSPPPQIVVWWW